ncbi:RES domain-containing protein [Burkholderia cepacia]|uniref:RES domain-containing protein n=1 Tax=Burkholderia cepacia TaxID=292 RepID=UPI0011AB8EBA|nr:RES domain-containing protein [Burkholderia cepacia]MDN7894385.1 RES domain-containing protein [Burkholderia cepacia]
MICVDCVKPIPLKKLITANGRSDTCQYCNQVGTVLEAKVAFDYIYNRVKENLATEGDLSDFEYGMLYEGGADDIPVETIDIVLGEWLELDDEPYLNDLCEGVPQEFKTNARGMETHFYRDDGLLERNFYEGKWSKFIEDISHTHRFFNPTARDFLAEVFSFLLTAENELKPECVRVFNQGEQLFRARNAGSPDEAKGMLENPASLFGPAPKRRASSQRMTPIGISALYCALDRETCLSEIRSITGDNVVSVALTPTTELKLLDLTKLNEVEPPQLTLLDEGYLDTRHLKTFITSLVKKMSRPKGRNDELRYLSTQVVFEYLRLHFGSQVDGLVFPSVQTGEAGTNVVLFPEASVISAKPYVTSDDAQEIDDFKGNENLEPDARLAVIAGSIRFHKILAIETKAKEYVSLHHLYMDDLTRKQMGPLFG